MITLCMRATIWTFQQQPYQRRKRGNRRDPESSSLSDLFFDTMDLMFNLRGIHWSWSQGLRLPVETRNVESTPSFLLSTLGRFILDLVLFDFSHYSVQYLGGPTTIGSPVGGSVFDVSLPPLARYTRSSAIVLLSGFTVCFAIDLLYQIITLFSVAILQQSPTECPPLFDKPWMSTSLNAFWALRWHQFFRDCFINFGGKPLAYLTGKAGGVIGAFLTSGIIHDFGLWGMGRGSDFQRVGGFFLMMGAGVILEHGWKTATGHRVGGFAGWVWTIGWTLFWAHMLVDAWALRGLVGSQFMPDKWRPSTMVFGSLFI